MFFDDRLATVLRQEAKSEIGQRTQFRQLLDILGNRKFASGGRRDQSLIAAAWLRMDALGRSIPARERAAMINETSWRFRSADLAAHLSDFEPDVASAALNRANLSTEDWAALIPRLPVRARGFLRLRRDLSPETVALLDQLGVSDRGLPSPRPDAEFAAMSDGTYADLAALRNPAEPASVFFEGAEPEALDPALVASPLLDASSDAEDSTIKAEADETLEDASEALEVAGRTSLDDADIAADLPPIVPLPIATSPSDESPIADEAEDLEAKRAETADAKPVDFGVDPITAAQTEPVEELEADIPPPTLAPATDPVDTGRSEISAIVEKIAQFKKTREATDFDAITDSERSPRLPLGEVEIANSRRIRGFGFASDTQGRIEWADAEVAPMVIGKRMISPRTLGQPRADGALTRGFMRRQPISNCALTLAGAPAIAGEWIVDAQPRFTVEGSFTGYVGRFRRPVEQDEDTPTPAQREADRIRQLLHELRTPVTAVQGYAEVIQQQLFGPAPHEYRALSATIAGDAARILAGFDELDRLARLESGAMQFELGESDLAAIVSQTSNQLSQVLRPRMSDLDLDIRAVPPIRIAIDAQEAELLIWRIMGTLGGGCGAGETLEAVIETESEMASLSCELPRQLLEEEDLFVAEARPIGTAINAGVFGAGLALRLARAEARAAGGDLVQTGPRIILNLPMMEPVAPGDGLTSEDDPNSPEHLRNPQASG